MLPDCLHYLHPPAKTCGNTGSEPALQSVESIRNPLNVESYTTCPRPFPPLRYVSKATFDLFPCISLVCFLRDFMAQLLYDEPSNLPAATIKHVPQPQQQQHYTVRHATAITGFVRIFVADRLSSRAFWESSRSPSCFELGLTQCNHHRKCAVCLNKPAQAKSM